MAKKTDQRPPAVSGTVRERPRHVIVSPCGTALLTNEASGELRSLLRQTSNSKEQELGTADCATITKRIRERAEEVRTCSWVRARQLSPELNGLMGFYGVALPPESAQDMQLLIHTDTFQGRAVAAALVEGMQARGLPAATVSIRDLSTRSLEEFQAAMSELVHWAEETLPGYSRSGYRVIFNLTGGFKSVSGFMQTLGLFYADEMVYLFETETELLRIPRLPVTLDSEGTVGRHLEAFRRLGSGQDLPLAQCADIPETLLMQVDGEASLSPWGALIWERSRSVHYRKKLLPPLSPLLQFSKKFPDSVLDLEADRLEIVNRRLDDLGRCLDSGRQNNPRSLDFKELRGNPRPPSTHECDAWADGAAKRIYGHFDGKTYIIDHLGPKLK